MGLVIVIFIGLFVLCLIWGAHSNKYGTGKDVTVKFSDSVSGKTIHAGHGRSVGSAIIDGFSKMWYSVSISSHEDTIRSKYNAMIKTLSDNRYRMTQADVLQCEEYVSKMHSLLSQKEKEREERDRNKTVQQKSIAEQRRLMTDSMRYDVMRRDGFRCVLCGAMAKDGVKLHVDHIFPVSKGGKTELSNLRTLCERCNIGKGAKIE